MLIPAIWIGIGRKIGGRRLLAAESWIGTGLANRSSTRGVYIGSRRWISEMFTTGVMIGMEKV